MHPEITTVSSESSTKLNLFIGNLLLKISMTYHNQIDFTTLIIEKLDLGEARAVLVVLCIVVEDLIRGSQDVHLRTVLLI